MVDDGVDGLALGQETVLALVLLDNSIQRANLVLLSDHHWLHHFKLEVALSNTLGSFLAVALTTFRAGRPNRTLQVELSAVLVLCRSGVMDSDDRTLIEVHGIVGLVAELRVVGCVDGRSSSRRDVLRVSICISSLDCQALDPSCSDCIACGRHH